MLLKNIHFIFFVLLFCTCKKEKVSPDSNGTGSSISPKKAPQVKTEDRFEFQDGMVIRRIYTLYYYDNLERPSQAIMKDTSYKFAFTPWTYTLNYSYNAIGKMTELRKTRSDMTFLESYIYDSNNTIKKIRFGSEVTLNNSILTVFDDSLVFTKENNVLISDHNGFGTFRSFYSTNLDSTWLFWSNPNNIEVKRILTRSAKEDLAFKHLNKYLPYVSNKHEAISEQLYDYSSHTSNTRIYEREYDQNNFPVKVSYKENSTILTITYYTYY